MSVRPVVRVGGFLCAVFVAAGLLAAPALAGFAVTASTKLPALPAQLGTVAKFDRSHAAPLAHRAALKRVSRSAEASPRLSVSQEHARAVDVLDRLISTHPILGARAGWKRTTVVFGPTPEDRQAVAFYTEGTIVIDPNHRASLEKILQHEVWHIIDYRDNGRIDWNESVPPA